ncbi:hypothetical protein FRX31_032475 [Thalictrum thalictroides]|uniref:Uncharacterized protein n=1 Tax=Thalictrum thalictroides TaxID=46969 RepID=A0A7J6UZR0_THATH|nr:hypothetical protein FRX31_032475 [Thalictrum thalictroides]
MDNDSMPMFGLPQIDGLNFYEDDTQNGVDTQATQEVNDQDIENEELEDSAPEAKYSKSSKWYTTSSPRYSNSRKYCTSIE